MILVVIAIVIARNLERSRMGRAWMAIREDEIAAEMMGVNTVRTKLLAFALGASFAGVAGSLQASYLGATTSDFFEFSTSILVLIMVILGGIGNIWGVARRCAGARSTSTRRSCPTLGPASSGAVGPGLPEPDPVQLPHLRPDPRRDDAVPARRASCRAGSARPSSRAHERDRTAERSGHRGVAASPPTIDDRARRRTGRRGRRTAEARDGGIGRTRPRPARAASR